MKKTGSYYYHKLVKEGGGMYEFLGSDVKMAKLSWRTVLVDKRIYPFDINLPSIHHTWYSEVKIAVSNG